MSKCPDCKHPTHEGEKCWLDTGVINESGTRCCLCKTDLPPAWLFEKPDGDPGDWRASLVIPKEKKDA